MQDYPFPILSIIPNEMSFAEVPSAHETGKQPFHESLLLFLVKRGLTVAINCGYFGFGPERGNDGGDEVEIFFHP